ncbi:MAG: bifunctional folylpolyglutamate synthase/dihydrofolate synthase [Geminicoccaceae bacterium]
MTSRDSDLILTRLQGLYPKASDLSLGRLERLLAELGHPERRLPPVVHIAGTNGKGSTLAMLDAMLQAAGHRVQRYISPHLVHFNERILFNGEPIDEVDFGDVLDRAERTNQGQPITFFEITTAAAFLAFAERDADILLLETGLGGRLDATNVVDQPVLTLISPISLDHQGFLGEKLEQIAGEKAGIFKAGVPAVLGPQTAEGLAVLEQRARELDVELTVHRRDWSAEAVGEHLVVTMDGSALDLPLPGLRGPHQIDNAGLATVAASKLGDLRPSLAAMAAGLQHADWPARLQPLTTGPLLSLLPKGSSLWLDGGHNPAAGEAMALSFDDDDPRPLHLIVGMLNTKDVTGFLAPLIPHIASLQTVLVPDEAASFDPEDLAREARSLGAEAQASRSIDTALSAIEKGTSEPVRVLICGSLYLAGHALRANC